MCGILGRGDEPVPTLSLSAQCNMYPRPFAFCLLHGETFSPGLNSKKPHVIEFKIQPGLKSELGHAR